MNRINMNMPKREMFALLQTLEPVKEKHKIKSVSNAIQRALEDIPDNEMEYMTFQIVNRGGVHIGTETFTCMSDERVSLNMVIVLRKVVSIPSASGVIVIHNRFVSTKMSPLLINFTV